MEHLNFQDAKLRELAELAKERFAGIVSDKAQYDKFLKDSIIQCIFKIWDEESVTVHCRDKDQKRVEKIMKEALREAKQRAEEATGETLEMQITLAKDAIKCAGGVIVTARN